MCHARQGLGLRCGRDLICGSYRIGPNSRPLGGNHCCSLPVEMNGTPTLLSMTITMSALICKFFLLASINVKVRWYCPNGIGEEVT